MNLEDYLPTNADILNVAAAEQVGASRSVLSAVQRLMDRTRETNEDNPREDSADLRNDIRFKQGMIYACKRILDLPGKAREHLKHLPEGE